MTMDLDSFENAGGYRSFTGSAEQYLLFAQEAAKRFLGERILDACSVYLADRFGEYIIQAYVPDGIYEEHELSLKGAPRKYFGFAVVVLPRRQEPPSFKEYIGQYYFAAPQVS